MLDRFQGRLCSKHPWETETASPWVATSRQARCAVRDPGSLSPALHFNSVPYTVCAGVTWPHSHCPMGTEGLGDDDNVAIVVAVSDKRLSFLTQESPVLSGVQATRTG